eukprot:1738513-Rhodomonas_salina.2
MSSAHALETVHMMALIVGACVCAMGGGVGADHDAAGGVGYATLCNQIHATTLLEQTERSLRVSCA